MKSRLTLVLLLTLVALALPRAAAADATAFLGLSTSPTNRPAKGFAIGVGLVILGFEFEYSSVNEDPATAGPSLRIGSFNGLVQTPVEIARMQFYGTVGGGVFREDLAGAGVTNFASNFGGGVKISLVGPIRLRVDYRVFNLNGGARYQHPQRIYAGLNLKF